MKVILRNLTSICLLFVMLFAISCKDDDIDSGDNYTLTTQTDVDNFTSGGSIQSLVISGEDVLDLSPLKFTSIGTLIIKGTGIQKLDLSNLTSVAEVLTIEGNAKLKAISGWQNLKTLNGTILINNNPLLTDISALLNVERGSGKLSVINNESLGEDKPLENNDYSYGLFPLKYLKDNNLFEGTIRCSNNHSGSAQLVDNIGKLEEGILSYVIDSKEALKNFSPGNTIVNNLTLKGAEITDTELLLVSEKVKEIRGTVTFEETKITTTQGFFNVIKINGGIVFRNNTPANGDAIDSNGIRYYKKVNGDLIIENTPIKMWNTGSNQDSFSGITEVAGDFRLINNSYMGTRGDELNGFPLLASVGGDLEISDNPNISNMDTYSMSLKSIGGDLIIRNNAKVNSLAGYESVKSIGGSVLIEKNGTSVSGIPDYGMTGRPGWCMVKAWIEKGIVDASQVTAKDYAGNIIDLSIIDACDGMNPVPDDGTPKSWTLASQKELLAFVNGGAKTTVIDLTILGPNSEAASDITLEAFNLITSRVATVTGTITVDGINDWNTTSGFFDQINCQGGIVIRNCPNLENMNGLEGYTEIHGDFIVENCPKAITGGAAGWAGHSFSNLVKVDGNFRVIGLHDKFISENTLPNLKEVGGDFEFSDCTNFWQLYNSDAKQGLTLERIGGSLILKNNPSFWSLSPFYTLTEIGGDIIIKGNDIPTNSEEWRAGLDIIKYWLKQGIVKSTATISLERKDGSIIDVNSLPDSNGWTPAN